MTTRLIISVVLLTGTALVPAQFTSRDENRWLQVPSGTTIYRPISTNARMYFEQAFVKKYGGPRGFDGQKVQDVLGFGVKLAELTQEEYTTSVVMGDSALSFGIGGLATLTGSKSNAALIIEYSRYKVMKGLRAGDYQSPAQRELNIHDYDFRVGFGARLVFAIDSKELKGGGTFLNYLNLGASKTSRTKIGATCQVVGITSPKITKAIPAAKIISTKDDLNTLLGEFKSLVTAIGESIEGDQALLQKPKLGTVCWPTLVGAIEYVPEENVGRALGDPRDKGSDRRPR